MTSYYAPSRYSSKNINKINAYSSVALYCNIDDIKSLNSKINNILKLCNLNVFGYDISNDKYWGKKIKNTCYLSFTITIIQQLENELIIIIDTLIDSKSEMKKILDMINKNLNNCIVQTEIL